MVSDSADGAGGRDLREKGRIKKRVLIAATDIPRDWFVRLSRYCDAIYIQDYSEEELEEVLPSVECLIFLKWPSILDARRLSKMTSLKVIQAIRGGVDDVPFRNLKRGVKVYNNLGAYTAEVAEYAFALLLASAKSIAKFDAMLKSGPTGDDSLSGQIRALKTLKGSRLGIIGYGNIGKAVGDYAEAFGMEVCAFVRRRRRKPTAALYFGRSGLREMLRLCDAFVLALPLSRSSNRLIGKEELSLMKKNAILVNVGRGDVVDEAALYNHLIGNPGFTYATEVWWYKEGVESYTARFPFSSLSNFIGTPHVSGPTAMMSGRMPMMAAENLILYLKNKAPNNLVDFRKLSLT